MARHSAAMTAATASGGRLGRLASLALAFLAASAFPTPALGEGETSNAPPEAPDDCLLECPNGGVCQKGDASFPDNIRTSHSGTGDDVLPFLKTTSNGGGEYCWCPDGWTGYDCGHAYEYCWHQTEEDGTEGGGFACFHGGTCKTSVEDGTLTKVEFSCDCKTAAWPDGNGVGLLAGLHCEHKATSTCQVEGNEVGFCVNYGTCKAGETQQAKMCECPPEWDGPHCEFHRAPSAATPPPDTETPTKPQKPNGCGLRCEHDGVCQKGSAAFPNNLRFTANGATVPFLQRTTNGVGEYCWCPDDWTGYDCQHQYEYCWEQPDDDRKGGGGFACFHGGTCKQIVGKGMRSYLCDCAAASWSDGTDKGLFAGAHCEHRFTDLCFKDGNKSGTPIGFCVNEGQCKDGETQQAKMCDCKPEWIGPHCEFYKGKAGLTLPTTTTAAPKNEDNKPQKPNDCSLKCANGGVCQKGAAVFPEHLRKTANGAVVPFLERTTNGIGEYCWCPEGWTGYDCNHDYNSCWEKLNSDGTPESGFACFHGGTCKAIPGGGNTDFICDCGTTNSADGTEKGLFAGAHCEHSPTDVCWKDGIEGATRIGFCVNNGQCKKSEFRQSHLCNCPDGWIGPHCEFHKFTSSSVTTTTVAKSTSTQSTQPANTTQSTQPATTTQSTQLATTTQSTQSAMDQTPLPANDPSCDLKCSNNGICKKGPADFGVVSPKNYNYSSPIPFLEQDSDPKGQHCWCPAGRTGIQCKHQYRVCDPTNPDEAIRGFPCFHSGKCTDLGTGGLTAWACDCSTANIKGENEGLFAGRYCEHEVTSECKVLEVKKGLSEKEWFCVNGGTCKMNESNPYKICQCPNDWTGPHCEYKKKSVASTQFQPEKCTLGCNNGGHCVHGVKDYGDHKDINEAKELPWLNETHQNGMHCVCPDGYTGLLCQIAAEKCGERLWCYNGSQCKKTQLKDGMEKKYCDCTEAATKKESFAGIGCQHRSGVFCDPDSGMTQKMAFCVNGGSCFETGDGHLGCDCADGWNGQHCEFHKTEAAEFSNPQKCKFECKNGGTCSKGVKDYGTAEKFNFDFLKEKHVDFEHCVCPVGYTGLDCSIRLDVCDESHVCPYGSQCLVKVTDSGKKVFACDCDRAKTMEGDSVAGKYCQHEATEYCVMGQTSRHSFCTNGGKCAGQIDASQNHPGCICSPGWTGEHCEFRIKESTKGIPSSQSSETHETVKTKQAAILFSVMVAVIALIILTAVVLTKKFATAEALEQEELKRQQQEVQAGNSGDTFDAERDHGQEAKGAEDGTLSDVDIL